MAQEISDLAGGDPQALRLLELADMYNVSDGLPQAQAAHEATIVIGKPGRTSALADFYHLAELVERWASLDDQRDPDVYALDTSVLFILFRLMHGKAPCTESLHAASTLCVGDLHESATFGWPWCKGGCAKARVSA